MTTILVDHNIEGQALLLMATLQTEGWASLLDLRMVMFRDVGLALNSTDRIVWRRAQQEHMLLLTDNRSMTGPDSLEETLRQENASDKLPIVTVSNAQRLYQRIYRELCAERLAEIVVDLNLHLGTARIFIP